MRTENLFLLSHVCNMSPPEIDETGFIDFLILCSAAAQWIKEVGSSV